jgi:hypothetical protein
LIPICSSDLNSSKQLLFAVNQFYYKTKHSSDIMLIDNFADRIVGDMPKSPSSQYGLKAPENIDPRGIRVTNGPMK